MAVFSSSYSAKALMAEQAAIPTHNPAPGRDRKKTFGKKNLKILEHHVLGTFRFRSDKITRVKILKVLEAAMLWNS